jgi:beta-lactamase regulating signal transducer with metallopeptidase domain
MENILYYLLKISVGTAVFYMTYHFLFRKSKQFVFNRLYLAGSFLASFIIPLITFKTKTYITEAPYQYITAETSGIYETITYVPEAAASVGLHQYLLIIYLAGVVFFLLRLAYAFIVAARIKANSTAENIAGMNINISGSNIRAFTFLDRIVISREILSHPSLNMVLVHEAVHSKEKHFVDILTAEILFILQWFNPFAWLKRIAIRNNLEFRADDVVARSFDPLEYQLAMLSMAQKSVKSPLLIELNSSNLKKRIIMMKSNRHNRFSGIARLAIIPVTAILLLSLSGKETVIIRNTENVASQIENNFPQPEENIASTIIIMQDKLGTVDSLRKFIAENLRYPQEAAEAGQMGYISLFASVNKEGQITEITTSEPSDDFVDINEIVFVGYGMPRDGLSENEIEPVESPNHENLISEGKRVINSFPEINIPELKGKTAKFNFRFVLQPATGRQQSLEGMHIQAGVNSGHQNSSLNAQTEPVVRDIQPALAIPSPSNLLPIEVIWPNVRHDSNDLITIEEVGKYLQYYRRYPFDELMAGHTGTVELYARVNRDGWVEEVFEQPPSNQYIEIKDTVVMRLGGPKPPIESPRHEGLISAGHRALLTLPRLDIPELQGKAIKVTFKWGLYNN